jgi:hypothetical protein
MSYRVQNNIPLLLNREKNYSTDLDGVREYILEKAWTFTVCGCEFCRHRSMAVESFYGDWGSNGFRPSSGPETDLPSVSAGSCLLMLPHISLLRFGFCARAVAVATVDCLLQTTGRYLELH